MSPKVPRPRRSGPRPPVPDVRPQRRQPGTALGPRAGRTIAKILESTRQIFLSKGYAGTTIDEVMKVAGVSRASFYTYFPSKRDVLLVLGGESLWASTQVIATLDELPPDWVLADLEKWVASFFEMLDEHGSFSLAWTQAAQQDEEIRRAGMVSHLRMCERLGCALAALRPDEVEDPTEVGLAAFAMLERAWTYVQLYNGNMKGATVHTIARLLVPVEASQ